MSLTCARCLASRAAASVGRRFARERDADSRGNRLFNQELEIGHETVERGNALDRIAFARSADRTEVRSDCVDHAIQDVAFNRRKRTLHSAGRLSEKRGGEGDRVGRSQDEGRIRNVSSHPIESRIAQNCRPRVRRRDPRLEEAHRNGSAQQRTQRFACALERAARRAIAQEVQLAEVW